MQADSNSWLFRGDLDLVRLERQADATLHFLIGDMRGPVAGMVQARPEDVCLAVACACWLAEPCQRRLACGS